MFDHSGPGWAGSIGGLCPVQGDGHVDEFFWYFRARYESWTFDVWDVPMGADGELPLKDSFWFTGGDWGDEPFAASYMPLDIAWELIEGAIDSFRKRTVGEGESKPQE